MLLYLLLSVTLLVVLGSLACHVYVHKISRTGRLINRIPGPEILPVFGNALEYMFLNPVDLWSACRRMQRDHRRIYKLWGWFYPLVALNDPRDLEVLLSSKKHITKAVGYICLHQWLGTGLLTSTGEKWHRRRRMLTPSFHFNILESFLESFEKHAKALVGSLGTSEAVARDVIPIASHYTLDVICETAMGVATDNVEFLGTSYEQLIQNLGEHITYRILRPWWFFDYLFSWCSVGREHAALLERLHGFTNRIVELRKRYHRDTGWSGLEHQDGGTGKRRMAMLDILIANWRQGNIDDAGIREEVDTFVFEGQDTTSRALTFAILCLAEHRECQDRCRREIDEVLGSGAAAGLRMVDLQRLVYLEQCVKETLRLYPSVPLVMRELREDMPLKGYVLPPGTMVMLSPYDVHRDPRYWPDAETFDPDRFLPEKVADRHPFSYIPFSGGYRNCIGQKFAMLELKTVLAYLLREFHLEAVDKRADLEFRADLVLQPTKPVRVRFLPRGRPA